MKENDYTLIIKDKSTDSAPLYSAENKVIPQVGSNVEFSTSIDFIKVKGRVCMVKYNYDLEEVVVLIDRF